MTKVDIYISFESKMLDNDDFMEQLKFISAKYENKWLFIYYKDKRPYLHLKYNENRKNKINLLNPDEKENYITNLRKKKLAYWCNLPKNRKLYYNKLSTLRRQFKKNKIITDFIKKKNELYINLYFINPKEMVA
jgi:hypothetical protein